MIYFDCNDMEMVELTLLRRIRRRAVKLKFLTGGVS